MQRFSKIKPQEEQNFQKEDIVYNDKFLKIVKYEDWSVLTGKDAVICIPVLVEENKFVIRQEYIPSFKMAEGQEIHLSCVGGPIEMGESPEVALLRELEEEAGIVLRNNFKFEFDKPLFLGKFTSMKIHPCIIPLNESDYHEVMIKGDGSREEKLSHTPKIDIKYLNSLQTSDVVTELMLIKLKEYLNL
jgi:8-oxo-dGTP pyrophosphatase MutT (NUDIX family)